MIDVKESTGGTRETIDNRSLTWYLVCRTAVITLLLGGAAVFYLKGNLRLSTVLPLFILIAVSYAEALVSAFFLKQISRVNFFAQIQITWDLLFVTALILLTNGVESLFSFAYLLIIVSASFLLSRRLTVLAASGAVVLFGGILDLQYFGYLDSFGLTRSVPDGTFFSTLFVHSVAFLLTAVLSGTLAERWRISEEQLERKTIDYAELEKMNRTILAHINSGLMLVSPAGLIRSFNRAAMDITHLSLQEVYDQQVSGLFPDLPIDSSSVAKPINRSEGLYQRKDGTEMVLGYAVTPARDSQGKSLGVLVTFQDLTQLKEIEEELKRTDRLAAVGRLAAAMAHEIRNPLASISGSVQLLRENVPAQSDEQRLMNIVVNEADRLNELLTSFLSFARPKSPEKELTDVSLLIDELIILLRADSRFRAIEVVKDFPEFIEMSIDPHQIRQALWDLAVNAAEALDGKGQIVFRLKQNQKSVIIVEDNGPGIDPELKKNIFEPFFSTKEKGTGLGLASVYAVVEAHHGTINVERGVMGGARFELTLPSTEEAGKV